MAGPSITFFAIPKSFRGHVAVIQRNAIRSWARLSATKRIVLFGKDEGVVEMAREVGAEHVPDIPCTTRGTPLLPRVFAHAIDKSLGELACYVNADIILTEQLTRAVAAVTLPRFLATAQRWDLDVREPIDFASPQWAQLLEERRAREGSLHSREGMDLFLFTAGRVPVPMPEFAVGRPGWDNWMIYNARAHGTPIVDLTAAAIVHQNHDYAHVKDGDRKSYNGPEADENRKLLPPDLFDVPPSLESATHVVTPDGGLERRIDIELFTREAKHASRTAFRRARATLAANPSLRKLRDAAQGVARGIDGARGRLPDLSGDRDVEWTFVAAHVGVVTPPKGRVLDFGCATGLLSYAAGSLGLDVFGVDLLEHRYSAAYPNVEARTVDLLALPDDTGPFDTAMCCSTIEHVGLPTRYGGPVDEDGDLRAMEKILRLLAPRGHVVMTIPVGTDAVIAPFHRVYGAVRLPRLLAGVDVVKELYFRKPTAADNTWRPCTREEAVREVGSEHYYALGLFVLQKRDGARG